MQLALGTAQFGLDYGISNQQGKVEQSAVKAILAYALQQGIHTLDTAIAYGNSEHVLGKNIQHPEYFNIISKLSVTDLTDKELTDQVKQSCQRLNSPSLYGLLLHNADELTGKDAKQNYQKLLNLKTLGFCHKIGVSVYNPEQLLTILENFNVDLVQVPCNILDQRFLATPIQQKLEKYNIEVHARSLFLQGLLLMNRESLPLYFHQFQYELERFYLYCQQHQYSPIEACLSFAMMQKAIDYWVVGITELNQLKEITKTIKELKSSPLSENSNKQLASIATNQLNLINPSYWSTS
ncbi:aldo/keto reductase [Thalassotalea insulae]|uniref:Aldo/keto reductase n=1 Tax=Thalassotalea insulae TaxID=2056778 RepID=A0ABQ6GTZ1_9GAMM|nr:aldo/keto reductase [Thalassotalea insulae]GLX77631.1 aldo/keto reductase [Thalassotalea insulae]